MPLLNGRMVSSPLVTLWTFWMASPVTPNAHLKKKIHQPPSQTYYHTEQQGNMAHETQLKLMLLLFRPVTAQVDTQQVATLKRQPQTY